MRGKFGMVLLIRVVNGLIKFGRKAVIEESRQWKPAVAYCRYADDFFVIVKGTKQEAEAVRDQCRELLKGKLRLTMNMEKTHITHVNDGFVFLGHRIIRKRGPKGNMRVVSGIPMDKAKAFAHSLSALLSGDYSRSKIDKVEQLNQKLKGWAQFYRHTDFTAKV
jgi:RNA-directed DNA polymerase